MFADPPERDRPRHCTQLIDEIENWTTLQKRQESAVWSHTDNKQTDLNLPTIEPFRLNG